MPFSKALRQPAKRSVTGWWATNQLDPSAPQVSPAASTRRRFTVTSSRPCGLLIGNGSQVSRFVPSPNLAMEVATSLLCLDAALDDADIADASFGTRIHQLADAVRVNGRPIETEPLNSYDRRLVHNAFRDDPNLATWSPHDDSRIKRITIKRRE